MLTVLIAVGIQETARVNNALSVALVSLMGQSRVFFAMSRDRLLPPAVAAISPRLKTPFRLTIVAGGLVAVFGSSSRSTSYLRS